ncbi:MAG: hypothetical protein R3290_08855 [Acidimicrobiia bacterium]|nr:hypothetical protein [Acidimicrobiia bacterium]
MTSIRRDLRFGVALVALVVLPIVTGFAIAGSTEPLPPDPTTPAAVGNGSSTPTSGPVVSDRPVGEAPLSAEDALSRQEGDVGGFARLQYAIDDSGQVRLRNGAAIPLRNDLELVVELSPFPANRFDIDVRYVVQRPDGTPVSDAEIDVTWDMTFMYHGPFHTEMPAVAPGTFESSFDFFMFGPWYLDTTVSVPGTDPIDLRVSVYVWPTG